MQVTWVVQSNLGKTADFDRIAKECLRIDCNIPAPSVRFIPVKAIPFDPDPPTLPEIEGPIMFYGATGFIESFRKSEKYREHVFIEEGNFDVKAYSKNYGSFFFNAPGTGSGTLLARDFLSVQATERDIFIRPNGDNKEFNGQVTTIEKALKMISSLIDNDLISEDFEIFVNEPFKIDKEWRFFVVDGYIVSGSQYRTNHELDVKTLDSYPPTKAENFAQVMIDHWSPAEMFVIDICQANEKYYVLECGAIHSAGFYGASIERIVSKVSDYVM